MAITHASGPRPPDSGGDLADASVAAPRALAASLLRNVALQDWMVLAYLATVLAALAIGHGPHRGECSVRVTIDFGVYLLVIVLVRGQALRWGGTASCLVQRLAMMIAVLGPFFQLREILPAVNTGALDASIYAFDERVFAFEPAVWLDRFVSTATVEWFAFFYFLYFVALCANILPMLFAQRDVRVMSRFGMGVLLVYFVGHAVYMIVPGFGPYWYLEGKFEHPLVGGPFWQLVRDTVAAGGSQKDIFPSLHTAAPTFFAIFGFRHRKQWVFRLTWPISAFVATQIIIATMFLRWHYLVDIVAGLALAVLASVAGQRMADWEHARRERAGMQTAWATPAWGGERRA